MRWSPLIIVPSRSARMALKRFSLMVHFFHGCRAIAQTGIHVPHVEDWQADNLVERAFVHALPC